MLVLISDADRGGRGVTRVTKRKRRDVRDLLFEL